MRLLRCIFLLAALPAAAQPAWNLMPLPARIEAGAGFMPFDKSFRIAVEGQPDPRLYPAAERVWQQLSNRSGVFFTRIQVPYPEPPAAPALRIQVERPGRVALYEDESYELSVTPGGALLRAPTDLGALRGLQTFAQLLAAGPQGYGFPAVRIQDAPRFPWRGLLLDVCCHWMPMDVVKRTLDGMEAVKLNVLHLHLSEDQAFRVESLRYPRLHTQASRGLYFTQEDIRGIVQYADARGIRIVPEFDVPGHTTAILTAYPELASLPRSYELERYYGVFDPVLDPSNEAVYRFIDTLFTEMAALFPDPYFHIGGDENTGRDWDRSPQVQAFMREQQIRSGHGLHTYFNQRVLQILARLGKRMMGWDEIFQPGLPQDIMIQSWRGEKTLYETARKGYTSLLSTGYYIDLIQPADYHYLVDPLPADAKLSPEEAARIVGGEATMWSEHVTMETVDSRIWPRTAAIAERLWSPQEIRDPDDMYRRLEWIELWLEGLGMTHLRNRQAMMRRLCGSRDIGPLETLVDVIEPLKIYQRNVDDTMYTVFSPYTLLADVAGPDQPVARKFRRLVADYLAAPDAAAEAQIRSQLERWRGNHAELEVLIRQAPALREAEGLSRSLSRIAQAGLEALGYRSGAQPPPGWRRESLRACEAAREQGGRCDLQVVDPIEALIRSVP
ncbi:MAG: beta-N-acetylhexosaminidase [Bacteroidia bacterium]|nr:beta-N-acetylhexosaminidase [Bacteroidia bacterium]